MKSKIQRATDGMNVQSAILRTCYETNGKCTICGGILASDGLALWCVTDPKHATNTITKIPHLSKSVVRPYPKPVSEKKRKYSGLKITPADKFFSLCVRERCGWICERCGKDYSSQAPTMAFHCSHYEGRGNWAVRLDSLDALGLCYGCHRLVGGRTIAHRDLYLKVMGREKLEILEELSRDVARYKMFRQTNGKGEVAKHFKSEYFRMVELRAQGVTGRIEFVGWI